MALIRNELRTGVLVLVSLVLLGGVLIFLGAPGAFCERRVYRVYFDNAGGINVGAPVMLAGRRVGQVSRLLSPVPTAERPRPDLAAVVEVSVACDAQIFRKQRVTMLQYNLLSEQVVDFTLGDESSGLATKGMSFIGDRQPGLGDVAQKVVDKLDPVVGSATLAMKDIQKTASQLTEITRQGSDLVVGISNFRQFGERLAAISGTDGALQRTLCNIETLTGKESPLARALAHAETFTSSLAGNRDIGASLRNFRQASESLSVAARGLKSSVCNARPGIDQTVRNAEQFTDTVKRQPWRLIWPSTKKYPDDPPQDCTAVAEKVVRKYR
ncbi:MAG: MlaD family protein [Chthoniobacteraceae bacterium]|nr:MlaD family protein [Chthoniobacteraceae bacterium]